MKNIINYISEALFNGPLKTNNDKLRIVRSNLTGKYYGLLKSHNELNNFIKKVNEDDFDDFDTFNTYASEFLGLNLYIGIEPNYNIREDKTKIKIKTISREDIGDEYKEMQSINISDFNNDFWEHGKFNSI